MESLWIENRRNAISIETGSVFFNEALWSWRGLSGKSGRNSRILSVPPLCEGEATSGRIAVALWTAELTIKPLGSDVGRGNRNCFFTRFVVKRQAYVAKRISAFCGHPRKPERVGRDFFIARGVFRSP